MIKSGYKQTDLGLLPEDWTISELKDVTKLLTNGFVGSIKSHYSTDKNSVLYIQGYNVNENSFNFNGIKRISSSFHKKHLRSELKYEDLLTVQTGNIGLTTFVTKNLIGANCHALIISRFKNRLVHSKFASFYLNSFQGRERMRKIETGTTMKHINVGDFKFFQIPLPPLPEQKAIATALSDMDALIDNLRLLIEKKKAVKLGTMQVLLTGKKRIKGFKEKWEEKTLGEIGNTFGGLTGKTKVDFESGKYPYITFLNVLNNSKIDTSTFEFVNIKKGEFQNKARKGDLFFNTSSETPEQVGMCAVLCEEIENLYLNSFCFGFRLNKNSKIDGLFLSYIVNSSVGRKVFESLGQGATRYNLSKTNFNKVRFNFPEYKEQKAIAKVLSDMEEEIEALTKQLEKYQNLKRGMMHELLTGKTRLKL